MSPRVCLSEQERGIFFFFLLLLMRKRKEKWRAEERVAGLERAGKSDKFGEGHGCLTEVNTLTFSVLWEVIGIFAFVMCDPVIEFLLQNFHENL